MRRRREHSKTNSRRHVLEVGLARAALDGALDGGEGLVVPVALGGLDGAVNDVLNKELQRKSAAAGNEEHYDRASTKRCFKGGTKERPDLTGVKAVIARILTEVNSAGVSAPQRRSCSEKGTDASGRSHRWPPRFAEQSLDQRSAGYARVRGSIPRPFRWVGAGARALQRRPVLPRHRRFHPARSCAAGPRGLGRFSRFLLVFAVGASPPVRNAAGRAGPALPEQAGRPSDVAY